MTTKIFNSLLILFAAGMAFRQGAGMLTLQPTLLEMFVKWRLSRELQVMFGCTTLLSALFILFPRTFAAGNFLMAATILMIICLQLNIKNIYGAVLELPFLLLNLVIIYLQYPLNKSMI